MKHVAIDLGGRESQLCVRAEDSTILKEAKVPIRALPKLLAEMKEPARVIVETSAEAFRIADAALAAMHEVRVVPATLVKQLGVGSRGVKNDRKGARVLSEQIEARRGKFIAVVALARKLSGILFALWRDETTYRPSKSAARPEESVAA